MSQVLKDATQEAKDQNLSASLLMKTVSREYMKHRAGSIQENIYRATSLKMKECSRQVVLVPLGNNPIRISLPVLQNTNNPNKLWSSNIIDKYHARPEGEQFEDMCLAEFASNYRIVYGKGKRDDTDHHNETDIEENSTIFKSLGNLGKIQ